MPAPDPSDATPLASRPSSLQRARGRFGRIAPNVQGMMWLAMAGAIFAVMNATMRSLSIEFDPYLTQFWRNLLGLVFLAPWMLRYGLRSLMSANVKLQVVRNLIHVSGLTIWFTALPLIPLAEMTAIGFTGPLFVTIGAALFLGEKVRARRWMAVSVGFAGVLIVLRPGIDMSVGALIMLCSAPLFAGSFLVAKVLARFDKPPTVVAWQNLLVALFSLPLALWFWRWPDPEQFLLLAICGGLGTVGHMSMIQAFRVAEISAIQPVNFINLIYASALGYLMFGHIPVIWTWVGGLVIFASATYIARREAVAAREGRANG